MAKQTEKKGKTTNKKLRILLVIALIIIAFGGGALVLDAFESIKDKDNVAGLSSVEETSGLLIVTEGSASIERNGAKNSYEKGEYDVLVGDFVETGAGSRGYVIFSDNSTLSLDENTRIQIEEQKHVNGNFVVKIEQLVGRTWSRVEKLFGGYTEYEVETPNTIAAVRGTEFGCDVSGENTICYAIVHDISVDSKDDEEGESILPEGEKFKNESGETSKEKGGLPDDNWKQFNECLNENINKVLIGDSEKSIDYLKLNKNGVSCGEVLGATDEEVVTPTAPKPVLKSVTDDGVYTTVGTLNCKWSATNATSFIYSLGTASGKTDILYWKSTTKNSSSSPSLPLVYGQKYFCNVIAKGNGGNSVMKSSDGIYYDASSGSLRVTDPNLKTSPLSRMTIKGDGTFFILSMSDLKLKYYVKSGSNYCQGAACTSSNVIWFDADIKPAGSSFSFTDTELFDGGSGNFSGAIFYFELYNSLTGKVLATKSVQLPFIIP